VSVKNNSWELRDRQWYFSSGVENDCRGRWLRMRAAHDGGSTAAPSAAARSETPSSPSAAVTSYCSLINSSVHLPSGKPGGRAAGESTAAGGCAEPPAPPARPRPASLRGSPALTILFTPPKRRTWVRPARLEASALGVSPAASLRGWGRCQPLQLRPRRCQTSGGCCHNLLDPPHPP